MITTGSKLFFGMAAAAVVGMLLWGFATDWGALGTVGLATLSVALVFLGAVTSFVRDADVAPMNTAAHVASAANQPATRRSMWPLALALGAGVTVFGLVSYPPIFIVGLVLIVAAGAEWMVQAWSERASGDAVYNADVRQRVMHPLELPIAGALLLGVIIYAFSRIMLAIDADAGVLVFALIAAMVLLFGTLIALRRRLSSGLVAGIAGIALVGLVVVGIVAALVGERDDLASAAEEDHYATEHRICDASEQPWDEDATGSVGLKPNVLARVVLADDGRLYAVVEGLPGEQTSVTVQRANQTSLLFRNDSSESRRLTVSYGTDDEGQALETCTAMTGPGQAQFVTFSVPKASAGAETPYSFFVPGVDGAVIEMLVP
ncbi:MAG: hypothetical protein WAS51_03585 [Ilumatobacteraceae bacterium]|nr:MAG: hypothetical protein IPM43_07155 [Actinomycetota bacterium]